MTGICGAGPCGATDNVHLYAEGYRCDGHAPWARAGQPHPSSARYCLAVCYCGECGTPQPPPAPIRDTVLDFDAVRSGKRRSTPEEYQAARDQPRDRG